MPKQPFNIDVAIARIRESVRAFPRAMLFELADDGFNTAFEQLVACIVSIRTLDEVSGPATRHLFAQARDPASVARLTPEAIGELIRPATFYHNKGRSIHEIAVRALAEHDGVVPCDYDVLVSFPGVGPKCANLVLGIACHEPHIGVDIHVHRVTNRWGYVETANERETTAALEATLPRQYWIEINSLLVPFGKHVCTGRGPRCSTCPILDMCQQRGVISHR